MIFVDQTKKITSIDDLNPDMDKTIDLRLDGLVNKQKIKVIKPVQGVILYRDMINYYAAIQIHKYLIKPDHQSKKIALEKILTMAQNAKELHWTNLGGQIITKDDLQNILDDISKRQIKSWNDVHSRYSELLNKYPDQKMAYACYCLKSIYANRDLNLHLIIESLSRSVITAENLLTSSLTSRQKDFTDPFRKMVFNDDDEMNTVLTTIEEDPFIQDYKTEIKNWCLEVNTLINELS